MADNEQNQPLFGVSAVSPQALALRRALLQKQIEAGQDTSPIRSPWQGVARIAQSVMGNLQLGMEERSEREARQKQIKNAMEGIESGDRAKLLGAALDPFTPESIARIAAERAFPHMQEAGAQTVPVNQITGRQSAPAIQHVVPLSESAGDVSRTRLTNPGQEGAMPAAPSRAGGTAPPPQRGGSTFQERVEPLAATSRDLKAKNARIEANINTWNEDMRAMNAAPKAIQQLGFIKDIAQTYNPTTGLTAGPLQTLKQSVNGLFGRDVLGETAPQEMLGKLNKTLATEIAATASKRGLTNFDLEQQMQAVPGNLMTSNKGTVMLADTLMRMKQQEYGLGRQFAGFHDPENYMDQRNSWFSRPENALVNPLTGRAAEAAGSFSGGGWKIIRGTQQGQ